MYLTVSWHVLPDTPGDALIIAHAVDQAFGSLPRCRLLPTTLVLRPTTFDELSTLVAQLDGIEQAFGPQFGYSLFLHTDGDAYRCSDAFDVAAARAITKVDPF